MKRIKKILLALLIVFIGIQFIQPSRNGNRTESPSDLIKTYKVPEDVYVILITSCYDCHSNNSNYPWYSRIQPFSWLLAEHIRKGKADLNFSEFGSYSLRRQISKLKGIENSIKGGTMPLWSYTLLHKNARLSKVEKLLLIDWSKKMKDSLENEN
jgi:hypothetical protein